MTLACDPDMRQVVRTDAWRDYIWGLVGYEPHKVQRQIHASRRRFRIVRAGNRLGKTYSAAAEVLPWAGCPYSYCWIVAPTHSLVDKAFRQVRRWSMKLASIDPDTFGMESCRYVPSSGLYYIRWKNGAVLEGKSADSPDSLQGEGLDFIVIDEAARLKETIWDQDLRPRLTDRRGGAVMISTPVGMNWWHDLAAKVADDADWGLFHFPSYENPIVYPRGSSDPEWKKLQTSTPRKIFCQQYLAEWVSFEGQVYEEFDRKTHVRTFKPIPGAKTWGAIDFGVVDPFVWLLIQVDSEGRVWVIDEYYLTGKTTPEHARMLPGYFKRRSRLMPEASIADARSPEGIRSLRREGFSIRPSKQTKGDRTGPIAYGIEMVKEALMVRGDDLPGLIVHPRCKNLIREMNLYSYRGGDSARRDEPQDKDNHTCDALRYFFLSVMDRKPVEVRAM